MALGSYYQGHQGSDGYNPYGYLSSEDQGQLMDYTRGLYQGPDYKGRNEANHFLQSQYAQMLGRWAQEKPVDYTSAAPIADQYNKARDRLTAQLGARGIGGSGIEAGAMANSYGQQAASIGDYLRQLTEQRRREHLAQQLQLQGLSQQVGMEGLHRNWQKQDSPGFFSQLLGTIGGLAGDLIPNIPGLGGGNAETPPSNPYQQRANLYPGYYGPGY